MNKKASLNDFIPKTNSTRLVQPFSPKPIQPTVVQSDVSEVSEQSHKMWHDSWHDSWVAGLTIHSARFEPLQSNPKVQYSQQQQQHQSRPVRSISSPNSPNSQRRENVSSQFQHI